MTIPVSYEQVTYNSPDGAQVGSGSTEKVGYFGATPIARPSVTQQSTSTTTALRADLNRLETALVNLGLIAVT
jgi:hypothetical protein